MKCSRLRTTSVGKLVACLLTVILAIIGEVGLASAATQEDIIQVPAQEITQQVKRYIMDRVPWEQHRVQIANLSLQGDLQVSRGQLTYEIIPRSRQLSPGPTSFIVVVHIDGKPARRLLVSATIEVAAKVVVAALPLARNQLITEADVRIEERDLARLPEGAITKLRDVVGKRTRQGISAGTPLHSRLIETPAIIKRGAMVTILAQSPSLSVAAQGQAKEDGAVGNQIRVMNLSSRKDVYAKVVDENTVRVDF
jgi:flagellar basal body P-ring formation protein FlgA